MPGRPKTRPPAVPTGAGRATRSTRAEADRPGAQSWVPPGADVEGLREAVHSCRGCELWAPATQAVFSEGAASASLMLVGEQPGDAEDLRGEPFVGPAGRVLEDALREAGIDGAAVYVTNAVKHFRFEERGKRRLHKKPGAVHVEACRPWLEAELTAVHPRVVVCLGATAARAVLRRAVAIGEERGRLQAGAEHATGADVLVTTHPSAVLRLRGREGWEAAFASLVADLRVAAAGAAA